MVQMPRYADLGWFPLEDEWGDLQLNLGGTELPVCECESV